MTQEELIAKLQNDKHDVNLKSQLELEWINIDEYGFTRTLRVTTKNKFSFIIVWYSNLLTIHINDYTQIWANDIWLDSCMPNGSKLDLRCSYKGVDSGFCIRILEY